MSSMSAKDSGRMKSGTEPSARRGHLLIRYALTSEVIDVD